MFTAPIFDDPEISYPGIPTTIEFPSELISTDFPK